MSNDLFRIDWDLHELGPKPAVQPDLSTQLDFSRFDLARALAAGYVPATARAPANARRFHEDEAA